MDIKFKYIKDAGIFDKERIVYIVENDCDLGKYLVAESTILSNNKFSSKIQNVFWLPDWEVKKGDLVVIYSKEGTHHKVINDDGSVTHFMYWGLTSAHSQNIQTPCVVMFEASWLMEPMSGETVVA